MKTLLEVREYQFKDGTKLTIELDRRTKNMSFVEFDKRTNLYIASEFKFAGRELSYMNGWKNILSAMQYVIDDAKKTMEAWEQEETDQLINLLTAFQEQS